MRILDCLDGDEATVRSCRRVIREEIGHPAKTVMVMKGRDVEISLFADRAATRTGLFPHREVLWVKNPAILTKEQRAWFDEDVCAVILDFDDRPAQRLRPQAGLTDIEVAFLRAQMGQGNV